MFIKNRVLRSFFCLSVVSLTSFLAPAANAKNLTPSAYNLTENPATTVYNPNNEVKANVNSSGLEAREKKPGKARKRGKWNFCLLCFGGDGNK